MRTEREAWLALAATPKYTNRLIWEMSRREGGPIPAAKKYARSDPAFSQAQVLTPDEANYPESLLNLHDPPIRLFWRGRPWSERHRKRIAVVGSRRATSYGLRTAFRLGKALTQAGVDVVSGLALGVDAAAHRGALAAEGGHPLGVLGCGIDRVYPSSHHQLFREMNVRGTLFSEYPLRTPAAPWRFPARNRLIAALSHAVVVVEASQNSGSLYTAHFAMDLGLPVLAVPGALGNPNRAGAHGLIREGAQIITSFDDVLESVALNSASRAVAKPEGEFAKILGLVDAEGSTFEEIQRKLGLSTSQLCQALTLLEIEGWLRRTPAGYLLPSEP